MGKPIWNWASRPEASRHKEGDIFCENRQGFCRSSGTGAAAGRIAGGKQVFDSPPADRAFLFVDAGFYAACPRNIRRAAARGAALHAGAQYHHPEPNGDRNHSVGGGQPVLSARRAAGGGGFCLGGGGCTGRRQNSGPPPGGCGTETAEPSGRTCAETDGICPAYQTGGGGQL